MIPWAMPCFFTGHSCLFALLFRLVMADMANYIKRRHSRITFCHCCILAGAVQTLCVPCFRSQAKLEISFAFPWWQEPTTMLRSLPHDPVNMQLASESVTRELMNPNITTAYQVPGVKRSAHFHTKVQQKQLMIVVQKIRKSFVDNATSGNTCNHVPKKIALQQFNSISMVSCN